MISDEQRLKIHLIIHTRGSTQKVAFFHWLMERLDRDWPFHSTSSNLCKVCGGGIWKAPRMNLQQLKTIGKQIETMSAIPGHFKLKIRSWKSGDHCVKELKEKLDCGEWHIKTLQNGEKELIKGRSGPFTIGTE